MSIRINVGSSFDAKDIRSARREIQALEDQLDGLNPTMARVNRGFSNAGRIFTSVGSALTSSVTVPLIGAGIAAAKSAADFSQSMSKIVGLVGLTADEVKNMEAGVLSLAGETAKSPDELAAALFVVTSAGLRGSEAMEALEVAAKSSAAGLGDTADIARAVAGAINAYGSDVIGAAEATDVIVATARAGNFETTQFAAALGRVLPFAQQAQASLQDVGGAVALLTRTNGNAAESITQIQSLFRAFVVPTEEAKTILDEVGLSAGDLREQMGRQGLVSTLRTLDTALGGNREVLGRLLGSTEAASAAFQILNADSESVGATFGEVSRAAGITNEAFAVVSEQSAFQFQQALADLRVVAIELGNELIPFATQLIEQFRGLVQRYRDLNPEQQEFLQKIALFVAAGGPLLILLGQLTLAVGGLATAFTFLLAHPAVLAIAAVAGLVAIIGLANDGLTEEEKRALETQGAIDRWAIAHEQAALGMTDFLDALNYEATLAGIAQQEESELAAALAMQNDVRERRGAILRQQSQAMADDMAYASRMMDVTRQQEETERQLADAAAAAAAATKDKTEKVVKLNDEMRELLQNLNDTYAGLGDAEDALAQYAREILASGQMTEKTKSEVEKLGAALRNKLNEALQDAEARLGRAQDAFRNYSDSIASGIRQGNTLADAASRQSDAIARLTAAQEAYAAAQAKGDPKEIARTKAELEDAQDAQGTFNEFLQQNVTTAEAFAEQVNNLRKAGASLGVLQQITQLGAETGGRIIAELLAGGAEAIKQANALTAAVEAASISAGNMAAEKFYGAGVRAAQAMVEGLRSEMEQLDDILLEIIRKIEAAFAGVGGPPNATTTTTTTTTTSGGSGAPTLRTQSSGAASASRMLTAAGFAEGGFVTGAAPIFGMLGEAGPEVIIPLDRMGDFGGQTVVNVTVTSADPQAVVEAIRRYTRNNGPLGGVVTL